MRKGFMMNYFAFVVQKLYQTILFLASMLLLLGEPAFSQSPLNNTITRNTVLEYCTGTWCGPCIYSYEILEEEIMPAYPNTIVLAYHDFLNDPFQNFPGNEIVDELGFFAFPSGTIDRVSGIIGRNDWLNQIQLRSLVAPAVNIELVGSGYNPGTSVFSINLNFQALENLDGEFRYNVILVQDSLIGPQRDENDVLIPDYVHNRVVRSMMNGALGEEVITGPWASGQVINKTFSYNIPTIIPAIIPDDCKAVVFIYQNGTPLDSNAEILQADQWELIDLNYKNAISSTNQDFLGENTETTQKSVYIKNEGLLEDTYEISINYDGPAGWLHSFSTVNGVFDIGETDQATVAPGDSTEVIVEISANTISGYGITTVESISLNNNLVGNSLQLRFATYDMSTLIVDDEPLTYENYGTVLLDSLNVDYGVVSSQAVATASNGLNPFNKVIWMCAGNEGNPITQNKIDVISDYLDNGGNIYLSGNNIAYHLADPESPYYTIDREAFLNDYLHAAYIEKDYSIRVMRGIAGDPITGNIATAPVIGGTGGNTATDNFMNQIAPADAANPIFSFLIGPNDYSGIKAIHNGPNGNGSVVFTTFGFESFASADIRYEMIDKTLQWFDNPTGIENRSEPGVVYEFELKPNYPNPFNPETYIAFTIPANMASENVSLVIFNQLGQKVKTLINESLSSGYYETKWDGMDQVGREVASGVYFYKLQADRLSETRKMLLIR